VEHTKAFDMVNRYNVADYGQKGFQKHHLNSVKKLICISLNTNNEQDSTSKYLGHNISRNHLNDLNMKLSNSRYRLMSGKLQDRYVEEQEQPVVK
jgi:hypothetical protein